MKKFVLFLAFIACVGSASAQLYLNELYVRPAAGNSEYFELYNSSLMPENADCFSLVTYFYNDNGERGFYVVDIPAISVAAHGFLVGGPTNPIINYQNGTTPVDFSWNDGNITRYVYRNGVLVADNTGAPFTDIFLKSNGTGKGENGLYATFLFKGSTLKDAFLGANNNTTVPDYITELGQLTYTSAGNSCGNLSYNFNNINNEPASLFGNVAAAAGTDNGYLRSGNGPCPDNNNWYKSSSPGEHTPGYSNPIRNQNNGNGQGNTRDSLTITASCTSNTQIQYNITGGVATDYPAVVTLYNDVNSNGKLDGSDIQLAQNTSYGYNAGTQTFTKPEIGGSFLISVDAVGICYDEVLPVQCTVGGISVLGGANCNTKTIDALLSNTTGNTVNLNYKIYVDNGDGVFAQNDMMVYQGTYTATTGDTKFSAPFPPGYAGQDFFIVLSYNNTTPVTYLIPGAACIVLPVNLTMFNAVRKGQNVQLDWQTAAEQNSKGFYVERLRTGNGWETVTFINSKATGGNSSTALNYGFSDLNNAKGVTQYRLQQVDIDGRSKYSEIRSVRGDQQASRTIIFPNPSSDGAFNIIFEDVNAMRNIYVSDMNGRITKQWRNISSSSVKVDNLMPGMYTIRIEDLQNGTQTYEKVVVAKR